MDYWAQTGRGTVMAKRAAPALSTKTAFLVFFFGLAALWGAVSLLFYLEIPS